MVEKSKEKSNSVNSVSIKDKRHIFLVPINLKTAKSIDLSMASHAVNRLSIILQVNLNW